MRCGEKVKPERSGVRAVCGQIQPPVMHESDIMINEQSSEGTQEEMKDVKRASSQRQLHQCPSLSEASHSKSPYESKLVNSDY